jgi:hypothetical protein
MVYSRYESYIDVEIQQRAVEYFELIRKGSALADVLAEMPKFPEREVIYSVTCHSYFARYFRVLVNFFQLEDSSPNLFIYFSNLVCFVEES